MPRWTTICVVLGCLLLLPPPVSGGSTGASGAVSSSAHGLVVTVFFAPPQTSPPLGLPAAGPSRDWDRDWDRDRDRDRERAGAGRENFALAGAMPGDVRFFVQMDDPAGQLEDLDHRPLFQWVNALLSAEAVGPVWADFARTLGMSPEALFKACFSGPTTFAQRDRAAGEPERLLVMTIERRQLDGMLRALRPTVLAPRHQAARYELEEHELVLARRGEQLLLAPRGNAGLLEATLRGLARPHDAVLEHHDAFAHRHEFPAGDISIFMQHAAPLGGWSIATASLAGETVELKQRSRFENSPFAREITQLEIDPSVLRGFEHHAMLALLEPLDIGETQLETFAMAALGEGLLCGRMRENLKQRRLVVVGEVEGRLQDPPVDLRTPTVAICFELERRDDAKAPFDEQMVRLVNRLNTLGRGAYRLETPEAKEFRREQPRSIDLSPAVVWLTEDLPLARSVSLNWSIADGPHGSYYVIATHPKELRGTVEALERGDLKPRGAAEKFQSAGFARGSRLGHHLRSWAEQAELIAAPGQADQVAEAATMLADLAAGLDHIQWRLQRPGRREMLLEVKLTLSPAITEGVTDDLTGDE